MVYKFFLIRHGRRKVRTTFYYCSVNHQSGLESNTFSKSSNNFFNTSKCARNYVISFEVYDGFIGEQILKLWRQESWPLGPCWFAHLTRIRLWTFRLPCYKVNEFLHQCQQVVECCSSIDSILFYVLSGLTYTVFWPFGNLEIDITRKGWMEDLHQGRHRG